MKKKLLKTGDEITTYLPIESELLDKHKHADVDSRVLPPGTYTVDTVTEPTSTGLRGSRLKGRVRLVAVRATEKSYKVYHDRLLQAASKTAKAEAIANQKKADRLEAYIASTQIVNGTKVSMLSDLDEKQLEQLKSAVFSLLRKIEASKDLETAEEDE